MGIQQQQTSCSMRSMQKAHACLQVLLKTNPPMVYNLLPPTTVCASNSLPQLLFKKNKKKNYYRQPVAHALNGGVLLLLYDTVC